MSFTAPAIATIPFTKHHGGIVFGKGGKTLNAIKHRFQCDIQPQDPNPYYGHETSFFLIRGPHLKAVNLATIEIYRLLTISLMSSDKRLREELEEISDELNHLKLVNSEKQFQSPEHSSEPTKIPETPKKKRIIKKKSRPAPLVLSPDEKKPMMLAPCTDDEESSDEE